MLRALKNINRPICLLIFSFPKTTKLRNFFFASAGANDFTCNCFLKAFFFTTGFILRDKKDFSWRINSVPKEDDAFKKKSWKTLHYSIILLYFFPSFHFYSFHFGGLGIRFNFNMVATMKQKTLTEKTNHSYRWRRQPHWSPPVESSSSTESPAPGDYCLAAKKLFQQWRFQREDELEGPVPRRANYYWPQKTLVAHFFSFGSEENSNRFDLEDF